MGRMPRFHPVDRKRLSRPWRRTVLAVALLAWLSALPVFADPAEPGASANAIPPVGQVFPSLTLKDQHGRTVNLPGTAHWILFAHSRAGDQWSFSALAPLGQKGMDARGLLYLSDISAAPSWVVRMFAMPALKERGFSVALIRREGRTRGIPERKGCVSLIGLRAGRIVSGRMLCSAAAVKRVVVGLPAIAAPALRSSTTGSR